MLVGRPLQLTVRPILRDRCPVYVLSMSVCNVGVLWPNDWIDQDATWYGGRPRPGRHCVRWGPSSPTQRGTAVLTFRSMSTAAKRSPISATAKLLLYNYWPAVQTRFSCHHRHKSVPYRAVDLYIIIYPKHMQISRHSGEIEQTHPVTHMLSIEFQRFSEFAFYFLLVR